MNHTQQVSRRRVSPAFLAALCCGACCLGCLDASVGPHTPPTPNPAPQPPAPQPSHTDAEFWSALADRVAAGRVPSTDRLIALCRAAQHSGDLQAAERLAEVLPNIGEHPEPITASNRDRIASALRRLK